ERAEDRAGSIEERGPDQEQDNHERNEPPLLLRFQEVEELLYQGMLGHDAYFFPRLSYPGVDAIPSAIPSRATLRAIPLSKSTLESFSVTIKFPIRRASIPVWVKVR